jgi:hypothetical protein
MSRCPTCCCTIADYAVCSDDLAVCPVLHGCPNRCHLPIFRRIGLRYRFCDRLVCLYVTVTLAVFDDEVSPGYDLCEAADFLVVLGVSELPISDGGCNPGNSTFIGSSVWLLNDSVVFGFVELVVSDEGNNAGENFLESV